MNTIISSFWGEGISDERFLPTIAQRVLEGKVKQFSQAEWDVYEPIVLRTGQQHKNFIDQVLDIAAKSKGFNCMFIHTDADAININDKALLHKINPALKALQQKAPLEYCPHLVPIIPVVTVENWKLCDTEALINALGVDLTEEEMGLNIHYRVLEERRNSKEMLHEIIRLAKGKSWMAPNVEDIDAILAKTIDINKLARMRAFQQFAESLDACLIKQNIIQH
ncbi:MAG: hypothetical protein R2795_02600 [Saprospiraceae bacterium]